MAHFAHLGSLRVLRSQSRDKTRDEGMSREQELWLETRKQDHEGRFDVVT